MYMRRTQIYLSEQQQKALAQLARKTGSSMSRLIRLAIDEFTRKRTSARKQEILSQAAGLWADHDISFSEIRRSLDRE